ncbi:MAG: polyphosphate kinase 1 [Bacteroidota bacterium]|nr:polyphosphate kinase 1 [Bacteroidota bacterium]MDP4230068.1 polyphosphate kinase 1 [Bacteroidota bacterium]
MKNEFRTTNREISWLQFNARVLQEARDERTPLFERIKFLAIYSSNLDEFFRVRVASLRSLLNLKKAEHKALEIDPRQLLKKIHKIVDAQQRSFGKIFQSQIVPDLRKANIYLVNESELSEEQAEYARSYFTEKVLPLLKPVFPSKSASDPFINNRSLYFAIELMPRFETISKQDALPEGGNREYAILEIPSNDLPRFFSLKKSGKQTHIMFLDDVVRLSLREYFARYEVLGVYSFKMTRDAELHIDDEFQGDLLTKIQEGLGARKKGIPSRFLYDPAMPAEMLKYLSKYFRLSDDDLLPGGKYHNFSDFMSFPNPGLPALEYKPQPPLPHPDLKDARLIFPVISQKDVMLFYPYQSYDYVLQFINQSAKDQAVIAIKITLYRVATNSKIVEALKEAAKNGKEVTAFVEIKARFDEERNLFWAGELERSGVKVLYSFPGLKVHCKLCIVTRVERGEKKRYCYLGSGNFNEKTATLYSDIGLFTTDTRITKEVKEVFQILGRKERSTEFEHLLVAPFSMRKTIEKRIEKEIRFAKEGKPAEITIKLNSLEDPDMIERLYEASTAGVKIRMVIRGICCLIPGVPGMSSNIKATSIIDRYLEHARLFIFNNGGDERFYVASADWMTRNLTHRIEVGFPIYDESLKKEIRQFMELQLRDNTKARIIAKGKMNKYKRHATGNDKVQAQIDFYRYLRGRNKAFE